MRRNERERLARRAAYQRTQALAKPFKVHAPGMTPDEFDALQDVSTAYHEAGHAVAAWIQGVNVAGMRFVPKGELTQGQDLIAVTETTPDLKEFTEQGLGNTTVKEGIITDSRGVCVGRINDGGVTSFKHAFITIAGPFAEIFAGGEVLPLEHYKHIFQIHGDQARTGLWHFTISPQADEIQAAHKRLADLVEKTFQEPRVLACVRALAARFHKARKLNEQEVRETIEAAWDGWSEQAEAAKAGE